MCSQVSNVFLRRSFLNARKLLLIQWLVWANILSHAYKGILLSKLATITYHGPIDTIQQMGRSDMPLYIPDVALPLVKDDPRDVVKNLISKGVIIKFQDVFAEETNKKY